MCHTSTYLHESIRIYNLLNGSDHTTNVSYGDLYIENIKDDRLKLIGKFC